ncbi:SufS family cysteine desulfurase [bacterium]|nr:SufS family cysteine desulfurase [bacterium]
MPTRAVALDIDKIRADFPALKRRVGDFHLAYLDNTAATMKPRQVIEAISEFYSLRPANVHRGIHLLSEESTDAFEAARAKVATLLNAARADEIVFTRNTTEAINMAAFCLAERLKPGDEVLCTALEHHADLIPWQVLRDRKGIELRFAAVRPDGRLDLEDWYSQLSERTKIAAFAMVSNVSGSENPVAEMCAAVRRVGAISLVDAAQGVPHMPVDVQAIGCDLLACSAYKMLAPFGIGALYGRYSLLEQLPPYQTGGSMISSVSLEQTYFAPPPSRFEAGTPAVGDAVGWAAAIDYLQGVGMQALHERELELSRYLHERLSEVPGLKMLGEYYPGKPGIASFGLDCAHPHDIAQFLNEEGVAVRAGHHCAEPLHRALGFDSTVRASLYLYNTEAEVDQLIHALHTVREIFA